MANGNPNESFDAQREQLAKVYASAMLAAIEQAGSADEAVEELDSLVADVLDNQPQFEEALNSHFLNHEEREAMIDGVFGGRASQLTINMLKVLSENDRLVLLRTIVRQVRDMYDEAHNRMHVLVTVATAPTDTLLEQIRHTVATTFQTDAQLTVEIDESILGGVMLRMGDTVYDGSVKTALERSRGEMVERVIEAIETTPDRFFTAASEGPAA